MNKVVAAIVFSLLPALSVLPGAALAAGPEVDLETAPVNMQDKVGLQNGAKLFVSYCMGCHSLEYMRYGRLAEDLRISEELTLKHLNFTTDKIGDVMENGLHKEDGTAWFGVAPPDLTTVERYRGADWVYTYLISFYEDDERPYGYNNHVFPNVGMPHVMAGMQESMEEDEFESAMGDITNFLAYAAEPSAQTRERVGVYVLIFLGILLIPAYLLKKEYWKDVH